MNSFIDILSRLIIATITFVAPMIVFCFGVFYESLKLNRAEIEKKQKQMAEDFFAELSAAEADRYKVIRDYSRRFRTGFGTKLANFFMNPKLQIILIFSLLFISIGCLMFGYLVRDNVWGMYDDILGKVLLHSTVWSYLLAVISIVLFVFNIVQMKERVETKKLNI